MDVGNGDKTLQGAPACGSRHTIVTIHDAGRGSMGGPADFVSLYFAMRHRNANGWRA
ncbi:MULTISPECIES: hypothetical protein [Cupriavidus]|uniref:hypothetical protein n=1 Tax=Cupriavidus sp. DF5525 TaxID=3160989 RepID=UPI000429F035